MKKETHIFQGMGRDKHPTMQNAAFLWEAMNVRITRREGDTFLAITNEKGNSDTGISILGDYVGHCVVGKYLVIFTASFSNWIYRIHKEGDSYVSIKLWEGNLGFSVDNPIDTFGVIEGDKLYKVYWIDGKHQPRYIIITMPELKNAAILSDTPYNTLYKESLFDFVADLALKETVEVKKLYGSGIFSPGVIQYAFTYYNLYGQESNICYTTPLQYVSYNNRAGSPEDRISCSFELTVKNLDPNFDYLRVYSIHRTTLDAVPTVKRVVDVNIKGSKDKVTIVDSGDIGDTIDPTQLLYIGGREFIPKAFEAKDGTLFFGNYELPNEDKEVLEILSRYSTDSIVPDSYNEVRELKYDTSSFYIEEPNRLDTGYNALFKTNEKYRIGIQAQLKNGTWTQPVFIDDVKISTIYPSVSEDVDLTDTYSKRILKYTQTTGYVKAYHKIMNDLKNKAKRLRACVVFPKTYERDVICQGVIAPTVYNPLARSQNAPFVQSSWFFRPAVVMDDAKFTGLSTIREWYGDNIQYRHDQPLGSSIGGGYTDDTTDKGLIRTSYEKELMNATKSDPISSIITPSLYSSSFYVDTSIVTFHSPDIEFDDNIWNLDYSGCKLRVVGYTELGSIYGDANITTSSSTMNPSAAGFVQRIAGYNSGVKIANKNNGGMVTRPLYYDNMLNQSTFKPKEPAVVIAYSVFPWNREGSLNNDINTEDRTRSAVLKTKVISNLKFFNKITPINSLRYKLGISNPEESEMQDPIIEIDTPQLFNSNEMSLLKQDISYLEVGGGSDNKLNGTYYGNVDTLITSHDKYGIDGLSPLVQEPVRMKYKSTPHLMFQFKGDPAFNYKVQALMPQHAACIDPGNSISLNDWIVDGDPEKNNDTSTTIENQDDYLGVTLDYVGIVFDSTADTAVNYKGKVIYGKEIYVDGGTKDNPIYADRIALGRVDWVPVDPSQDPFGHNGYYRIVDIEKNVQEVTYKSGYVKIELNTSYIYSAANSNDNLIDISQLIGDDWESKCSYTPVYNNEGILIGTAYRLLVDNDLVNYPYYNQGQSLTRTKNPPSSGRTTLSKIAKAASEASTRTHLYKRYIFGQKCFGEDGKEVAPDIAPYLLIVELVKDQGNKYGGKDPDSPTMQELMWLPASDPIDIVYHENPSTEDHDQMKLKYGDTWFDRYDCLKTYPFTTGDPNQIVEVGSFMCETRVNLNGRSDRNKGELSLLNMSPTNFNILNRVYDQKDNYFNYSILDKNVTKDNSFPHQFVWTKQKINKEAIDSWTNITLANTYDADTKLGSITDIIQWNRNLLLFQDKGISTINFNSRVQIPVSDGVPVELSNAYKVDGYSVVHDGVGCQDKWTIAKSKYGVYFADYNTKSLYSFDGNIHNLSNELGMDAWSQKLNNSVWSPISDSNNGMRCFTDDAKNEVYFVPGPGVDLPALCYSEELKQFTSLLSYNGTPAMFNINDGFYSLYGEDTLKLWENFKGDYNYIYDNFCPYYISFISNDTPTVNKIFDTVEYQANLFNEDIEILDMPFNKIDVYNEYQEGSSNLDRANTRKKFRIWRTNIPRSSKVASRTNSTVDITRQRFGRARMNNQWLNIKLSHTNNDKFKFVLTNTSVGLVYN